MVVGDVGPGGVVDQVLGVGVEHDPLRDRDRLALVDEARDERAERTVLADAPMCEAGQRADRIRGCVEDHLAPLGAARVGHGGRGQAGAGTRLGEALDLFERRRPRLEGAERGVALDVPLHVAGLDDASRREGRPADHALDVLRQHLLVAEPVLDGAGGAAGERVRRRGDRGLRVHRLRRDDPEVARGQVARVRRSARVPDDLARAREPQPRAVDRVDMRLVEVVGPDLDVVEAGEVRGEERADRAAADDADPHARLRRCGSRTSRPPVSPEGRTISTSAISEARMTSRVPDGRSSLCPNG